MIEIDIDDAAVTAALSRLVRALSDPEPALQEAGEYLVEAARRRFADKTAPDGTRWRRNRPATIARKGRNDPLIGESKRLSREIHYRARGDRLEIGSPLEYAAVQQFGARRGAFGATRKGAPIPWGRIPARPFLGLSDDDAAEVVDILTEYARQSLESD